MQKNTIDVTQHFPMLTLYFDVIGEESTAPFVQLGILIFLSSESVQFTN